MLGAGAALAARRGFVIGWNMQGKSAHPAARIYPGDDVADITEINAQLIAGKARVSAGALVW